MKIGDIINYNSSRRLEDILIIHKISTNSLEADFVGEIIFFSGSKVLFSNEEDFPYSKYKKFCTGSFTTVSIGSTGSIESNYSVLGNYYELEDPHTILLGLSSKDLETRNFFKDTLKLQKHGN